MNNARDINIYNSLRDYCLDLEALNMFEMNNGTRRALQILNCGKGTLTHVTQRLVYWN